MPVFLAISVHNQSLQATRDQETREQHAEEDIMTTTEASKSGGMGKDLVVYACLLALAGLEFAIAFQNIDTSQMLVRMVVGAIVEAEVGRVVIVGHLYREMWL